MSDLRLWHGGRAGLRVGDVLTGQHDRPTLDGCPWCQARARGEHGPGGIDGPSQVPAVYVTTSRLYAAHYASLAVYGDLYRVEALDELTPSTEDSMPTWTTPRAVIVAVVDRAVRLRPTDRRRLLREWTEADFATWGGGDLATLGGYAGGAGR